MLSLVISGYHYSIDILAAVAVTASLWTAMQWLTRIGALKFETRVGRFFAMFDDAEWPERYKEYLHEKLAKDAITPADVDSIKIDVVDEPSHSSEPVSR
jgi:hypothetical protein